MASDFAPTMLPNAAAVWRCAIEDLSPHASPCRYLLPAKWSAMPGQTWGVPVWEFA